jgi:hypothetical protein
LVKKVLLVAAGASYDLKRGENIHLPQLIINEFFDNYHSVFINIQRKVVFVEYFMSNKIGRPRMENTPLREYWREQKQRAKQKEGIKNAT